MVNCLCGLPCARRTSWTHDNPGRKFLACKFYNPETGQRGCHVFDWVDVEEPTGWQRDVINTLVAEKHRLSTDNHILKSRLVCNENEKNRLAQELEKIQGMDMKNKGVEMPNYQFNVLFFVVVSVVVSFIVVKLFG